VKAIKLINPRKVLPAHYGTWPPIEQDAHAWADAVRQQTSAEPFVIAPGESIEV
jgi:L-ascorbate metabolism protein UlaG (beta-lactamase superfamily)